MTINIFVLKGDLNGKIVVVRFFFCQVYIPNLHIILDLIWLATEEFATNIVFGRIKNMFYDVCEIDSLV